MERMGSGFARESPRAIMVNPLSMSRDKQTISRKATRLAEGTGNLAPPLITNLKLSYEAHGAPQAVVTQNGFLLRDLTDANARGIFFPFVGVQNLAPPIYAETAPTLYLGFDKAFPEQPITLFFVVAPRAFSEGPGDRQDRARVRLPAFIALGVF